MAFSKPYPLNPTTLLMFFRYSFFLMMVIACAACKAKNAKPEVAQSIPGNEVPPAQDITDSDFDAFIKKFSEDSVFQIERTHFPLQIRQYDMENDQDTIRYEPRSAFKLTDFRSKKTDGPNDQWDQEIVLDKTHTKATIEIRGIENGIMVDYFFEKIDGRWMLISIYDAST